MQLTPEERRVLDGLAERGPAIVERAVLAAEARGRELGEQLGRD